MADGNAELLAAFDSLAKSVNQAQIGNSIKRAQSKVDEIRANQNMNDFEKIKAQQALANAMGTEVIARGGDAAQAQQARLSLAPEVPDAAMRTLEATGKGTLAEAQKAVRIQGIADQEKELRLKNKLEMEKQAAHDAALLKAAGVKSEGNVAKRVTDFGKALDPSGQRQGMFSKPLGMIQAADRVEALYKQFPDGNMPKSQTHEFVASVAAMVNGGSVQSQKQLDDLVPESVKGSTEDKIAWLFNNPQGRGQGDFLKLQYETALREKEIAKRQIYDIQDQRTLEFQDLLEHPNPTVKARANAIRDKFTSAYRPADAQGAPSAQNAQGYPVGQGAAPAPLGKYIKINP